MSGIATRLLLGAASLVACTVAAVPASAQDNPFVPSRGMSSADMDRIEARFKAMEARIASSAKAPASATPGVPGAPTSPSSGPGSPIPGSAAGSPLVSGAPGGIAPYGAPGGGMMQVDPFMTSQGQRYNVSPDRVKDIVPGIDSPVYVRTQANEIRFLGCINGVPKFVSRQTGQRVVFSTREINEAQKTGVLPTCR